MLITCPQCRQQLSIDDRNAGQNVQCGSCSNIFTAIASQSAPAFPGGANYQQNPYAAPQTALSSAAQYREPQELELHRFEVFECFSAAWNVFKIRWPGMLLLVFLTFLISLVPQLILQNSLFNSARAGATPPLGIIIPIGLLLFALNLFLTASLINYHLKICAGEGRSVSDMFGGAPYMLRFLGMILFLALAYFGLAIVISIPFGILAAMTKSPGLVGLAVIPVYGFLLWLFSMLWPVFHLIVDKEMPVIGSLRTAQRITVGNRLKFFLTLVLLLLIGFVCVFITGLVGQINMILAIVVYLIISLPFALYAPLLFTVIYLRMTGQYVAYQSDMAIAR